MKSFFKFSCIFLSLVLAVLFVPSDKAFAFSQHGFEVSFDAFDGNTLMYSGQYIINYTGTADISAVAVTDVVTYAPAVYVISKSSLDASMFSVSLVGTDLSFQQPVFCTQISSNWNGYRLYSVGRNISWFKPNSSGPSQFYYKYVVTSSDINVKKYSGSGYAYGGLTISDFTTSIADVLDIGNLTSVESKSSVLRVNNSGGAGNVFTVIGVQLGWDRTTSTGYDLTGYSYDIALNAEVKNLAFQTVHSITDDIAGSPVSYWKTVNGYPPFTFQINGTGQSHSPSDNFRIFLFNSLGLNPDTHYIQKVRFQITPRSDSVIGYPTTIVLDFGNSGVDVYNGSNTGTGITQPPSSSGTVSDGVGNNINDAIDNISDSSSKLDISNIANALSDFFTQLESFPLIFKDLFSWLPSWILQYFIACIGLVFLVFTIRIVLVLVG